MWGGAQGAQGGECYKLESGDKKLSVERHVILTTTLYTTKQIFMTLAARQNPHLVEPTTLNLIIEAKTLITEQ